MVLPSTLESYDSIMVVVDELSKMEHFLLCRKKAAGVYVAKFYFQENALLHEVSKSIVSDENVKVTSSF